MLTAFRLYIEVKLILVFFILLLMDFVLCEQRTQMHDLTWDRTL